MRRIMPIRVMRDPAFPLGQRLSAGFQECLILQHAPTIARLWPTPRSMIDGGRQRHAPRTAEPAA